MDHRVLGHHMHELQTFNNGPVFTSDVRRLADRTDVAQLTLILYQNLSASNCLSCSQLSVAKSSVAKMTGDPSLWLA